MAKDGAHDKGLFKKARRFARSELQSMVDYYGIELNETKEEEPPDEGGLVWNVGDLHVPWPLEDPADDKYIRYLENLLMDEESLHEDIYQTYKRLKSPGVVYLHVETIRALLHHMSVVERPSPEALQRFLSIMDDMKTAHIHITQEEWTSAIHLAGRATKKATKNDVQSALHIWRDMEQRAKIQGGHVTFNVLFVIAVKAKMYALADSFLNEVKERGLTMHRHFRTSLISYYGKLRNGDMVRQSYQDLVAAGDIVDTVVMNAVISALMRAGEPAAAEHVFERMKRLDSERMPDAPGHRYYNKTWRDKRALGLYLTHEGDRLNQNEDKEALEELQGYAPIAPDARTYGLLIRHEARTAGNIDRVHELLQEMRHRSLTLEGTIFIVIFHGFNTYGGVRYTSWTPDKLEKVWKQFHKALYNGQERTFLSSMAVISTLKAFKKCTDDQRTLNVWEDLRKLWQPSEEELEQVMTALRRLVPSLSTVEQLPNRTGFWF